MTETATMPTREELMEKLAEVKDPEINMGIVELGLVYDIQSDEKTGEVLVTMTLTSPGCPLGPVIRGEAYAKLKEFPAVKDVDVAKKAGVNAQLLRVTNGTHLEAWAMAINQMLDFFDQHKKK